MVLIYAVVTPDCPFPSIPASAVTSDMKMVRPDGTEPVEITAGELGVMLHERRAVRLEPEVGLAADEWLCLDASGVRKFKRADEKQFRIDEARRLLTEGASVKDPEQRMEILSAAAAMRGFDAGALYRALQERRKPGDETLFDTYMRNRIIPK